MVIFYSSNARRVGAGSVLERLLVRITPQPDTFVGGVRAEGGKWSYRRMWVDPLRLKGVTSIRFSPKEGLQVRVDAEQTWQCSAPAPRSELVVLSARDAGSGAAVLLAVPAGELVRFGIDML